MDFQYLDRYLDAITADKHIPGVGVTVYRHGRKLHTYTAGYANIAEKRPFAPDTVVNLYSCTKVATATAGMKLVSEGRLALDAPAAEYLPELAEVRVKTPDGRLVPARNVLTVRHLFSMTGGFSYDVPQEKRERFLRDHGGAPSTREVAREIAAQPLLFEPGTHFKYSFCHDVLGAVIEIAAGMRFSDYLRQAVFDPLEMYDTGFGVPAEKRGRVAPEYHAYDPAAGVYTQCTYRYGVDMGFGPRMESGGGGLTSTLEDYGKLAAMLANGGVGPNGARILPPAAIDRMRENQLCPEALDDFDKFGGWSKAGYGYGLGVRTLLDRDRNSSLTEPGEFGWDGALGCYLVADPASGIGIFYAQQEGGSPWWTWHNMVKNLAVACAL